MHHCDDDDDDDDDDEDDDDDDDDDNDDDDDSTIITALGVNNIVRMMMIDVSTIVACLFRFVYYFCYYMFDILIYMVPHDQVITRLPQCPRSEVDSL